MKLTVSLAKKLFRLTEGETLPRSQLQGDLVAQLLHFLSNQLGIDDLSAFIETATRPGLRRAEAVQIASDSKLKNIRTFKGFLVNCTKPLATTLNGAPFLISPTSGAFTYIYDFERFIPESDCIIVGVENGENFRFFSLYWA